jgi:hypothetical protein
MTKCVYCSCTANIEPGKGYCSHCGHDAVAHVNAGSGGALGLKLLIAAAVILAAYFFINSKPDNYSNAAPGATALPQSQPATPPAGVDPEVLPPPTVQPNGQKLPAAPPLGPWKSNPGQ